MMLIGSLIVSSAIELTKIHERLSLLFLLKLGPNFKK